MNGIWDEILRQKAELESESNLRGFGVSIEKILGMTLSEFARLDTAIQIFSKVLDCEIWLCPTDSIASQIKQDDPEAVTYTVGELRELIRLNPTPDDLTRINNEKIVFNNSKIVEGMVGL